MKFTVIIAVLVVSLSDVSLGDGIPVVLWTNKQNIRYPMLISGKSLTGQEFHDGYLEQVLQNGDQNIVVFVQDQLSLNDITNYADVFNDQSDGDAFSSVKGIMEDYESTHISSVVNPVDVLKKLQRKFEGKVHTVENEKDIEEISLSEDAPNMVVISLPTREDLDRKKSIKKNDEIIGKVTNKLSTKKRPFTAVYTAYEATQQKAEYAHVGGRHLLQAQENAADKNNSDIYTFFSVNSTADAAKNASSCLFMYFKQLTFKILQIETGKPDNSNNGTTYGFEPLKGETLALTTGSTCDLTNNSAVLKVDFSKGKLPEGLTKFIMTISVSTMAGFWSIKDWSIDFAGKNNSAASQTFDKSNWKMDSTPRLLYGTIPYANPSSHGYSYHCGKQQVTQMNSTISANTDLIVRLNIVEFQMQFKTRKNQFGPANECIGFFSGAIWMTIIFFILFISILTFGMSLLASIQTMDRFDDPKGKTIQVNTSD